MVVRRSEARLMRFAVFAFALIGCGFILFKGATIGIAGRDSNIAATSLQAQNKAGDPDPKAILPASESKKIKATFVTLARNSDLEGLLKSIRQIEDRFNSKYNYDWVFLNEQYFSQEFKKATSAIVTGNTKYGLIEKENWGIPSWIDKKKAANARMEMSAKNVPYGGSISYRHMCRFELGFFFRHPLMMEYDYYWRVEPDIQIFCDIDYDIFKWMQDNNKEYSFVIGLPEYQDTIPTLWNTTKEFIAQNPQYLAQNNMMRFISDDNGETYNKCHFWSNFEIGKLEFFRLEAYIKYFEHLDMAGGFFYERWGDAPVHSIAVSLFMPMEKVHYFSDVGYFHMPFSNCPVDPEVRAAKRCVCRPNYDITWHEVSCIPKYHDITNLPRMKGWELHRDNNV